MSLYRVLPAGLNLRSGPDAAFPVVLVLARHTALVGGIAAPGGAWLPVRTPSGQGGWVAARYVVEDAAPWLTVASAEEGVRETKGRAHTARILEYHATTTLKASADEVPWCSSFVNWAMLQTGILGTRLANARSWLAWGEALVAPKIGAIAVFSRGEDPKQGHVGIVMACSSIRIHLLGGNHGNAVDGYWFDRDTLLGLRWPVLPQAPR